MEIAFYIAAAVAVIAALMVLTSTHVFHALLYLVVSLLAVALIFFVLGSPFAAALEAIVYAGAIAVLFVFVVMMLNVGSPAVTQERRWLSPGAWIGPALLSLLLLAELAYVLWRPGAAAGSAVEPRQVGLALFGPYVLGVELASMLLLAGLVGVLHLARPEPAEKPDVKPKANPVPEKDHARPE